MKAIRYRQKPVRLKPHTWYVIYEIARAATNARKRSRAVLMVSFYVAWIDKTATMPADIPLSNLRRRAIRIAAIAAAAILVVFKTVFFIIR